MAKNGEKKSLLSNDSRLEHKWFSFCCVFNFWLVTRLKTENDDRAWLIDWLVWMWATNGCEGNNNWIHFRHYLDKKKQI